MKRQKLLSIITKNSEKLTLTASDDPASCMMSLAML